MSSHEVEAEIAALGISRITHFTSSRNLPRILASGEIRSTKQLEELGAVFEPTDQSRLDGFRDHICCNVEFPNHYYFAQAAAKPNAVNYSDWSLFLLNPSLAAREGTRFAPGNAAKNRGADVREGREGITQLYEPSVYDWRRAPNHRRSSPTDIQAELLIPGPIALSEVQGIVVPDRETLRMEQGRLLQIGQDISTIRWLVSPGLFDRASVVAAIRKNLDIAIDEANVDKE